MAVRALQSHGRLDGSISGANFRGWLDWDTIGLQDWALCEASAIAEGEAVYQKYETETALTLMLATDLFNAYRALGGLFSNAPLAAATVQDRFRASGGMGQR